MIASCTDQGSQSGRIGRDVQTGKFPLALPIRTNRMQWQKEELGSGTPPDWSEYPAVGYTSVHDRVLVKDIHNRTRFKSTIIANESGP